MAEPLEGEIVESGMGSLVLYQPGSRLIDRPDQQSFWDMVAVIVGTPDRAGLVAAASARVYSDTYRRWAAWCDEQQRNPLVVGRDAVLGYLTERSKTVSKGAMQRELSALRTLADQIALYHFDNPLAKVAAESLKKVKPPKGQDRERSKTWLEQDQIVTMLDHYRPGPRPAADASALDTCHYTLAVRNRAILALLLSSGIRRDELVNLKWADLDLAGRNIRVRHGKGDKARDAYILTETAVPIIALWRDTLAWSIQVAKQRAARKSRPISTLDRYEYVFPRMSRYGTPEEDLPLTANVVFDVVKEAGEVVGIPDLGPHDCRRTAGYTVYVSNGNDIKAAQAALGHARAATTADHYMKPAGGDELKQKTNLGW